MHIVSAEKPTFMMILFYDDGYLFYGATRSAWILKLKFFEMMLFA